jgi:hypothetical protein
MLAITSFAFMLVEVPAPPWIISTGKLVDELAGNDALASRDDRLRDSSGRAPEIAVGHRRRFLT